MKLSIDGQHGAAAWKSQYSDGLEVKFHVHPHTRMEVTRLRIREMTDRWTMEFTNDDRENSNDGDKCVVFLGADEMRELHGRLGEVLEHEEQEARRA